MGRDIQAVSDEVSDSNTIFSSGSLCTDPNGERSNCDLQLLHTLTTFVDRTKSSTTDTSTELDNEDSDIESVDDVITSDLEDSEDEEVPTLDRRSKYIRFVLNTIRPHWQMFRKTRCSLLQPFRLYFPRPFG